MSSLISWEVARGRADELKRTGADGGRRRSGGRRVARGQRRFQRKRRAL